MSLRALLFALLGATTVAPAQHVVLRDLDYAGGGNPRQTLDLHLPSGAASPVPLVVYIHGGGWRGGAKGGAAEFCDLFLASGYAVADINYRLSGDSVFPAQIHDCKAAVRWLKLHGSTYQIDSSRVAVTGSSAGGHLASLLGTSGGIAALEDLGLGSAVAASTVRAVIPFYGPSDLRRMNEMVPLTPPDSCRNPIDHESPDAPETALLGCTISSCPDRAAAASPVTYADPADPPFLVYHGTFDCSIPPYQSVLLDSALRSANVRTTLVLVPHAEHGFRPDAGQKQAMLQFLEGVWDLASSVAAASPALFGLEQNFPNPFNPSTTIRYTLAEPSPVALTITNALGQTVASLVDEVQGGGRHQVRYEARGQAAGVYFVRLVAGEHRSVRKIVLIR